MSFQEDKDSRQKHQFYILILKKTGVRGRIGILVILKAGVQEKKHRHMFIQVNP